MEADTLIADKAFDADARVLEPLAAAGKTTVIPPRSNRSSPRDYDRELYAARHLIEISFARSIWGGESRLPHLAINRLRMTRGRFRRGCFFDS